MQLYWAFHMSLLKILCQLTLWEEKTDFLLYFGWLHCAHTWVYQPSSCAVKQPFTGKASDSKQGAEKERGEPLR